MTNEKTQPNRLNIDNYWGCPCCDLLVKKQLLNYHQKANCPRCKKVLVQPVKNSIEKILALSIGALILFFPAILLPLMTLNLLGFSQGQSIAQSISAIYDEGYYLVAGIILITCIVVPLLKISILFFVSLSLFINNKFNNNIFKSNLMRRLVIISFRIYHSIEEWGMLEIYMLGIVVSVVKLEAMATLHFNLGLIIYIALIILTLLSSIFLDEELFWETIQKNTDDARY